MSTKKAHGASRASVVQILRPPLSTFGSRMVLPLGRGAQKKLAERLAWEWCTVESSRALPCERGARPGKFAGPRALPCESGARWAVRGRSRVGVVHSGEFTGAPVRAWCASWKVIGGLREFVLVTRPFFRSLRNPSADLICSECWFFICIAHLEAGGAGFLLCFGALVWEGVQSLST